MTWLVAHDVLPRWTESTPPSVRPADWLGDGETRAEYLLQGEFGRIGSLWTSYLVDAGSIRRDDLIWIESLPLPIAPLRIEANSVFTVDGMLDEFTVRIESITASAPIRLHGERFHADFSFTLEHGPSLSAFKIPLTEGGLISGAFSPFSRFHDLEVGQTWRMLVFNPLAAITGLGKRFIPVVVSVTGEERLRTPEWEGNCRIVEAQGVRAWVDAQGEVQRQQVDLPVLGKVTMDRRAAFDIEGRNEARRKLLTGRGRNEE